MIEYHVQDKVFTDVAEGAAYAVVMSIRHGQPVNLDIVVYNEEDAQRYGGDDAVEKYREDPDASVFERFTVKAESVGRVR